MSKNNYKSINIPVFNHYYPPEYDEHIKEKTDYNNEIDTQKSIQKVYGTIQKLFVSSSDGEIHAKGEKYLSNFKHIDIYRSRKDFKSDEDKLILEILPAKLKERKNFLYIKTGLYIGYLNVDGVKIEINTGYNEPLLKRMLNVVNNIYFDNSSANSSSESGTTLSSLILEYMFLVNFKRAFAMGIPTEYIKKEEHGLNIRGNLNANKYLSRDVIYNYKVTYNYNERVYVQDIVDTLFLAFMSINSEKRASVLSGTGINISKYEKQLKELYSGKRISKSTLRRIDKHKSLNNPMYSRYKDALKFAKYILEYKGIVENNEESKDNISGFLIDASELWEEYLAKLLSRRFSSDGYSIHAQEEWQIYKDNFYGRSYFPDIIMKSSNGNVVLDAKFKKMRFDKKDVDRSDLHQIHSYAGYYLTKNDETLGMCALIYPSVNDIENPDDLQTNIYGLSGEGMPRFSIQYLKIGNSIEEMIANENQFLDRIEESIFRTSGLGNV